MSDLMKRIAVRMADQYDAVPDGSSVIEGIAELVGIDPTEENGEGIGALLAAGQARIPTYAAAVGPYAPYCAGFLAGIEFAIAARRELEADPR